MRAKAKTASQAGRSSRRKGKDSENEFAGLLRERLGVRLNRNLGQCREGGHDLEAVGEDPASEAISRYAIEVKRHSKITQGGAARFWLQAEAQAVKAGRVPALAFRADREDWRVMVPLSQIAPELFGEWAGCEWAACLSVDAFCCLVRARA